MKNLSKVAFVVLFAFSVTACNTMAGAGKDIQKGGEKLENSAEKSTMEVILTRTKEEISCSILPN